MESRFRKIVGYKWDKVSTTSTELDLRSIPYQAASPEPPPPIFIYQPLQKSSREVRKLEEQGLSLKGLAYDAVPAGKAPIFVDKPEKGNGPVKLQTSRRLSSGELLPTMQNHQRTLEDIREGDYIVGRKDLSSNPLSKLVIPRSGSSTPVPGYATASGSTSSRPVSTRTTSSAIKSTWSSPPSPNTTRHVYLQNESAVSSPVLGTSSSSRPTSRPTSKQDQNELRAAGPLSFSGKHTALQPIEEQNATIAALWRAEYSRLVTLYGQAGADYKLTLLDRQKGAASATRSSVPDSIKSPLISLEPLPRPAYDGKPSESQRSSATSGHTSNYRDDASDASSTKRESISSSWAASSSYTTQTSFGDCDSPTTRDDIRKIVAEMRSTYLRALETHSPPRAKTKSTKKKRRMKATSQLTTTSTEDIADRQTWHGKESVAETSTDDAKKPRATSHPVQGFGRLSTVATDPSTEVPQLPVAPRPELQRADSMTLGGLMIGLKERRKSETKVRPLSKTDSKEVSRDSVPKMPAIDSWLAIDAHFTAMDAVAPELDQSPSLPSLPVLPVNINAQALQSPQVLQGARASVYSEGAPPRPPRPTSSQLSLALFNFI